MSDYIPTTDEVRDGYYSPRESYEPDHNAEFDRWLAQHDSEITAKAEKRIIKLLEENLVEINTVFAKGFDLIENKQHTYGYIKAYETVIALIKGEK